MLTNQMRSLYESLNEKKVVLDNGKSNWATS